MNPFTPYVLRRAQSLWLYAGLLAFLPHLLASIYAGTARPGFSHRTQFLSELGERGAVASSAFNYLGLLPTGLLLLVFGVGLAHAFRSQRPLIATGALIAVHGVFRSVAAAFPCDLGCRPLTPTTTQLVHNAAAGLAFLSLTAAVFTAGAWMLKSKRNRMWMILTYALGMSAVLFQILLIFHHEGPTGLYQRIALGGLQLWVSLMATYLMFWEKDDV